MSQKKKPSASALRATADSRHTLGRARDGEARFTAVPTRADLPVGYAETLAALKNTLAQARLRTVLAANSALVTAYWEMGRAILARQQVEGWGAKVIDRLSSDLRAEFPGMTGLSPRNLLFMRSFAEAWPDPAMLKQPVSLLPWGHIVKLIQRLKTPADREWYARQAVTEGWSRATLDVQIDLRAHLRTGQAQHNFPATLPAADSDLAAETFKDPYVFDFLGTADLRRERELESALTGHIQKFLLELGAGFAFVGRQVHLEVGDQDFYLDLLFYHTRLRRYVVVELKSGDFEPGYVGQMSLYLSAVDDLLRHRDDQPTIGLLLCKKRNKLVVEYALRGLEKPVGVANWTTRLTESLPGDLAPSLPTVEQLEAELASDVTDAMPAPRSPVRKEMRPAKAVAKKTKEGRA